MPAKQMPMVQNPVMMSGLRPSFSMVKHCQGTVKTDGLVGSSPPG